MKIKKALALLLALVLTVGLLPGRALAAEDDGFTVVNTEQELTNALKNGAKKIKLGKDISLQKTFFMSEGKLVLDLDGYALANPSYDGGDGILNFNDTADVVIQNGTVSGDIVIRGGTLALAGLELNGAVYCVGGKLVSMEDCTITGGNGSDYPVGIIVREDGAVGTIKNCTINLTGNVVPSPVGVSGHIDTIEGCTLVATSKSTEYFCSAIEVNSGSVGEIKNCTLTANGENYCTAIEVNSGSVGAIKNCTIAANGKNYCTGIRIYEDGSVKAVEGCTITAKNTAADTPNDAGIHVSGEIGTVKECKITARTAIDSYGRIDEISGCTLNGEYDCISTRGSIGSILSNAMTATAENTARNIEVTGTIGTVSGNTFKTTAYSLLLHADAEIERIIDNTSNGTLYSEGKIGTVSGNTHWMIHNLGTIDLLGKNFLGRSDMPISNKGTIKETDTSSPLDSLDKNEWYYEAMVYAYEKGLAAGIPSADFAPNGKLTRAMLTQMLWNLEEWPAPGDGKFTDVASGAWYRHSVNWAADKKVVTGYNGQFMPNNNITREDVATILYRYVKQNGGDVSGKADLSGYPDASKVSSYAQEAMQWAVAEKLIRGSSGALNPKGNTTCAEMATIMQRFVEG